MDIGSILSASTGLEKVMGDVLRVLGLYRRLWLSEIYAEIRGMNSSLNEELPKFDDVERAVRELQKLGYVVVEQRTRASLSTMGSVEDLLVTLNQKLEILQALANDKKLQEYNQLRYSSFSRFHKTNKEY